MSKKKIKLYLHHDVFQEYAAERGPGIIIRLIKAPFRFAYRFCYGAGLTVIWLGKAVIASVQKIGDGGINTALLIHRPIAFVIRTVRFKQLPLNQTAFKISAAVFLLFVVGTTVFLHAGSVISSGLALQGKVLGITGSGLDQLEQAQASLQNQQTSIAQTQFAGALKQFQQTQAEIDNVGGSLNGIFNLIPQKRDAEAVVSAISDLTSAGLTLTKSYEVLNGVKFSAEGLNAGDNKTALVTFDQTLNEVVSKVDSASEKLNSVSESSIPDDKKLLFVQARDTVSIAKKALHNFQEVYSLFAELIGGNKDLLVFFQNNNELRPTGGFLGTYGKLDVEDGKITNMKISSIYDLDGQLTDTIAPPQALLAVNDRWFLRDSNWFFNFPESARKMISFYEKEGGQTPDMVMTMTPELVVNLLAVTGPIAMPAYGTTLTKDNFVETTQLVTSVYYDRGLNQPKQMLADFFPVLLQRISSLSVPEKLQAFEALQGAFAQKQILLYSRNSETQRKIEQFNWGGVIADSDRDYLAVINTNLGGTKTDTYIDQNLNLQTEINANGEIVNTLTITRKNTLQKSENTRNTSYVRVYVPNGSKLLEASGFSVKDIPPSTNLYNKDADIAALEATAIQHVASGTYVGTESNKSVFGNWMIIEGGQTQTVTVKYSLPFTLSELDRYSLISQKQPGAVIQKITQTISYPDYKALWQTSNTSSISQTHSTVQTHELRTDQFTGIVLERIE
ncbi:MAG: DUF4012 domain-containing protein [Candidatus Doudnabacteria bacterium]|nr:DUF4012 domain-containing protein [Candidatus Doudnabacteria bacterium]